MAGPRHDAPPGVVARKSLHAAGSASSRRVWPVGAVSKQITSYSPPWTSPASRAVNWSKAAISTVQAPPSCSSIAAIAVVGRRSRYGPTTRSR